MAKILDEGIQKQIQQVFADLIHPVEILFFGKKENCEYCEETQQLLAEVVALSELLALSIYDIDEQAELAAQFHVDKTPGFTMLGKDGDERIDYGIRYAGIPAGHEFTSLINDLLIVSKRETGLSQQTREFLAGLKEPVYLQVFTTPT